MSKKRLDQVLVDQKLVGTRQKAQSLIIAGKVLVNDFPQTKPGYQVQEGASIRITGEEHPFVSRGGLKLQAAIEAFGVKVSGRIGMDVGASTGGFSDVLLKRDISKVFAIDVGTNQLAWEIRKDPRVVVLEKVNARYLTFEQIGQKVDIIVMDVSFISLDKIFPALLQFSHSETDWITLIKPQFEIGKGKLGKGGIVKSEEERQETVDRLTQFGESLGLIRHGLIQSPITGSQGNQEFLAHWKIK